MEIIQTTLIQLFVWIGSSILFTIKVLFGLLFLVVSLPAILIVPFALTVSLFKGENGTT